MDPNDIPQDQTDHFPEGFSEHIYKTEKEMRAFLDGVYLADDIDVEAGEWFRRGRKYVVRVKVGNF